jgi:predicted secreted protein with PEFG-CTERM motif
MNSNTSLMLLAVLAVVGTMTMSSAYAGNGLPLDISSDSTTYDHESTITVTGTVANVIPGNVPVTITVVSPLNSIVTIDQINVSNDGMFKTTISTAGALWKYDGTYTIKVNYGSLDNNVNVELTGGIAQSTTSELTSDCSSNEVSADGYCIPYDISGGMVTSATINTNDNSIIINIDANDDGTLTISPPKSTQEGIFMILVDGEESNDVTITGNTVTIMFPAGAETIEIIGTFVIPEFGTIAAMILAVAIISIIAISSKSRLSIIPRY